MFSKGGVPLSGFRQLRLAPLQNLGSRSAKSILHQNRLFMQPEMEKFPDLFELATSLAQTSLVVPVQGLPLPVAQTSSPAVPPSSPVSSIVEWPSLPWGQWSP